MKSLIKRWIFLFSLTLIACSSTSNDIPLLMPTESSFSTATQTPFQPIAATATSSPLPIPTATVQLTSTPDPFLQYMISDMRSRNYGGGLVVVLTKLEENDTFTRYKIHYPSDGLTIYGFMNVPKGDGPFPVIIVIHGNYDTTDYQLLPYSSYDADVLSRNGYLVFHPNMRNYGESSQGDNLYRAGYAIDILNLIAIIKTEGQQPGSLVKANPKKIGIWAHSMGGEIALRVLTVTEDIQATVLYAPMTGDLITNAQFIKSAEEFNTPAHLIPAISPNYSYGNITSAIKLYHGTADPIVPLEYSKKTCQFMTLLGKEINCTFYEGAKHTFNGNYTNDFEKSFFYFYQIHLLKP